MPSILIEFGFITNPTEEAQLMDPTMQCKMAEAVACAFQEYKNEVEGKTQPVADNKDKNNDADKDNDNNKNKDADKAQSGNKDKTEEGKKTNDAATSSNSNSSTNKANNNQPATNKNGVCFKVQLYATPDKVAVTDKRFSGLVQVDCYYENSLWKYTSGNVTTYEEAQQLLTAAKAKFPDAFIISFKDGKKIPVSEARKLAQ